MANRIGKMIFVVVEVHDTQTTLKYTIREFQKESPNLCSLKGTLIAAIGTAKFKV